jgi:GTP-binding protein EngB required for normal cell division
MNNLIRTVLIGPTGAGKSQFCNFIHKDLTNSICTVSNSLNSCTKEPKSTIVERQNIRLELIDSPGSSDSNNNDEENLKKLALYLRGKKELNQILLVLSFHDRLSRDTRQYLNILSWIFTPRQFLTNLMIIFTHYPENPDEDDISKYELFKKEIKQELDKIFQVPAELKLPDIPIYFMNTKIFKKDGIKFFDKNSELAANDFIEELKLRISSTTYSIIDTTDLDCDKESIVQKIEKEKSMILKEIEELKKDKEKREKLNRDLEIEEQRYRELMSRRQSNNRDSLTGFGIFGAGAILLGLAIYLAILLFGGK